MSVGRSSFFGGSLRRWTIGLLTAVYFIEECNAFSNAAVDVNVRHPQHTLQRYDVDLEIPPGQRFRHVWEDVLRRRGTAPFAKVYSEWAKALAFALPDVFGPETTPEAVRENLNAWLEALRASHPDAVDELEGFTDTLQKFSIASAGRRDSLFELPLVAAATANYVIAGISKQNISEAKPSACTSTLALAADGRVLHGRSLDYEPRDELASVTVIVDYRRAGKTVYRCLQPVAFNTATQWFTCVRPGAFSLSVNSRLQGVWTSHNATFQELMRRVRAPGARLLGEVAELAMQAESYEEALAILSSASVVSSNYFILAGAAGQGAIVTRYANATSSDVWSLRSSFEASDGQLPWFRVQTNVDHWVPFGSGLYATVRRQTAVDFLTNLGHEQLDREALMSMYFTDHARAGFENNTKHEDTGVILRPSTIASLLMEPAAPLDAEPNPDFWHIWSETPTILPPLEQRTTEESLLV